MKRQGVRYILASSVALATGVVYLATLANGFVDWDDFLYVVDNPHIRALDGSFFRWAFCDFYVANWHPLTWVSHGLDYALWGLNPLGHHLTNVVLHSVNTFLAVTLIITLVDVFRRKTLSPQPAVFMDERGTLMTAGVAGLLFGLHPLHVESVAWVSERKDLLCALFFLLSIIAYTDYVIGSGTLSPADGQRQGIVPGRKGHYVLSLFFFVLALLSKPMAVSLPAVFLILDWFPFGRYASLGRMRRVFAEKIPFLVLSLASSIVTIFAQKAGSTIVAVEVIPLSQRLSVASRSLLIYLQKMLFPVNLSPFYPYPAHTAFLSPAGLLPLLAIIAVTVTCIARAARQKIWLAAWCYYLITLLPVLGILQVGAQARADRYTYLPGLGPFVLAGIAAAWGTNKARSAARSQIGKCALPAIALLVFTLLTCLTVAEIGIWKSSYTLWNHVIEKGPDAPIAYNGRAVAFYRMGNLEQATSDLRRALELNPHYGAALYNMACIASLRRKPAEACGWLRRSIENGYHDRQRIENDPDFDNIRQTSCYRGIMAERQP